MQDNSVIRSTHAQSTPISRLKRYPTTSGKHEKSSQWAFIAAFGAFCALALSANAQSQQLYKEVGPDGRITFSDRPANSATQATEAQKSATASPSGKGSLSEGLPFELRAVVNKFPVTLYTSKDCAPCDEGRRLLSQRGVPFNERTIATEADGVQLQKLSGQGSLPVTNIGSKRLIGYSQSEWDQYLTAAGYPTESKLPPQYRRPAPQSLAPTPAAPAQATEEEAKPIQPRALPAVPSKPGGDNAAGIVF